MIDMSESIFEQKNTIETMFASLLNEGDICESKKYKAAFETLYGAGVEFEKALVPEQRPAFRRLSNRVSDVSAIASRDFFVSGFKLGMRLAIQSLKE